MLAALAVPATAGAVTTQPGTYDGPTSLAGGPVLTGGQVAWAAQTPAPAETDGEFRQVTDLYSAPAAGGVPTRLARVAGTVVDAQHERGSVLSALAGSPGYLAWMTEAFDSGASKIGLDPATPYDLWVRGADGKAVRLCSGDRAVRSGAAVTTGVALDANLLGVSGCSGAPGVNVRDLSQTGSAPIALAADGGPVRLAGAYAAWRTSAGFEVLDRAGGTQTALSHSPLPAAVDAFDVAPDGVLAVSGGAADPISGSTDHPYVAWASPADPQWHVFDMPGLLRRGIHVRAGRIAVMRRTLAGPLQVRLVGLSGRQVIAAEGNDPRTGGFGFGTLAAGFDFDGTSVAWAGQVCGALVVKVSRFDTTATLPVANGCPVLVDSADVRVRRAVAVIRLWCPAPSRVRAADVCEGTARVAGVGAGSFRVRAGRYGLVRLKLNARGTRTLARKQRLKVKVVVRSVTHGRVSRSEGRVLLRAPRTAL